MGHLEILPMVCIRVHLILQTDIRMVGVLSKKPGTLPVFERCPSELRDYDFTVVHCPGTYNHTIRLLMLWQLQTHPLIYSNFQTLSRTPVINQPRSTILPPNSDTCTLPDRCYKQHGHDQCYKTSCYVEMHAPYPWRLPNSVLWPLCFLSES